MAKGGFPGGRMGGGMNIYQKFSKFLLISIKIKTYLSLKAPEKTVILCSKKGMPTGWAERSACHDQVS